jgi:hypothetical protein
MHQVGTLRSGGNLLAIHEQAIAVVRRDVDDETRRLGVQLEHATEVEDAELVARYSRREDPQRRGCSGEDPRRRELGGGRPDSAPDPAEDDGSGQGMSHRAPSACPYCCTHTEWHVGSVSEDPRLLMTLESIAGLLADAGGDDGLHGRSIGHRRHGPGQRLYRDGAGVL